MAVDQLDDQQGRCPWPNKSAVEVRHGKVGPHRIVGDEGGGLNYLKRVEEAWV